MARQSAGNTYACLSCGHGWLPKTDWEACPACFLTPKQAELNVLLTGPQRHTLLYGGARSGKTVLFVRAIMQRAIHAPNTRHAMLRLRANAARASLWLDTIPKVNKIWYPQFTLKDHRQDGYVEIVESGSQIWIAGTDDKQRVEKILGQEFLTLYFNECSQIPYPHCRPDFDPSGANAPGGAAARVLRFEPSRHRPLYGATVHPRPRSADVKVDSRCR